MRGESAASKEQMQGTPQTVAAERAILLVEDSAPLAARLCELLTRPGKLRVERVVDTEAAAVHAAASRDWDVMIVDVELREGSGIGVVERVRAARERAHRPFIVVLTNYAVPAVRKRCLAAGADYFLDKMKDFDALLELVSQPVLPPPRPA